MTVETQLGRDDRAPGRRATTSGSRRASGSRSSSTTRTDREIPAELAARRARRWAREPIVVTFAPRARSGAEPPAPAAAAMAAADVVLCAASTSLYHTTAKAAAQRAGARGDFNAPYRADAWRNGAMTADFFAIRARAERLAALWRRTREVRITSPAGTDLRATVTGREPMAWLTGICRNPGEVSALPGGEVSLPPIEGTSEGIVVWERVASDLGALEEPVRSRSAAAAPWRSRAGRRPTACATSSPRSATPTTSARSASASTRRPGSRDEITEAKKAFGTVHIALGDSANEYGGLVECEVHLDGLVMSPTIEFDGVAGRRRRPARVRRASRERDAALSPRSDAVPGPQARADHRADARRRGRRPADGGGRSARRRPMRRGSTLVDPDGNRFVDLAGSFAAATIGHSHPDVVAAVRDAGRRARATSRRRP